MKKIKGQDMYITVEETYWRCDICHREFKDSHWGSNHVIVLGNHSEKICDECYYHGILWAIKKANKEP